MTREEIVKSMSLQDAIEVLKDTNTYGTADIAKSVAIDTMRKYQKIEDIYYHQTGIALENSLRAVIENDN